MKPLFIFSTLWFFSQLSFAETIILSDDDIARFDIRFAPVTEINQLNGARLPATVISSPEAASNVSILYDGVISEWHVRPGANVQRNELLATIRSQSIVDMQNEWLAANTQLEQARFDANKDQTLFEQGIISQQRLLQTQRQLKQAEFSARAHSEMLERAGFNTNDLAKLSQGTLAPGLYYLRSPASGVLTHLAYRVGDFVAANAVAANVRRSDLPWVSITLPARLANSVQVGQAITIADANAELIVQQKDFEIDQESQSIEILAEFTHATSLLPGQLISVLIPPTESGVLIPASAVVHAGNETSLFVVGKEGIEVRTLALQPAGNNYLATEGIGANDIVVVQGAAILKGMLLGLGGGE